MNEKSMAAVSCIFVLLAGASLAQSRTTERRSRQQDQQFLRTIAIADMTDAHLGEMAEGKAAKAAVKDFGQAIAKDNAEEYKRLSVLANKAGETIPKGIDARKSSVIRPLTARKGGEFDRDFLRTEIADERKVISVLQTEVAHGTNPEIKAWAGKAVSARQQELQQAQSLEK
jgi:putative membrane protein